MTTKQITDLAQSINKFDWGYEMSDSYATIDRGESVKRLILNGLEVLSDDEIGILQSNLNDLGDRNMRRYFKSFIPTSEMLSDCCGAPSKGGEDYGLCSECGEHCEYSDNNE